MHLADQNEQVVGRITHFYHSNQYAMAACNIAATSEPKGISSPLSRKLHSGDGIALIIKPINLSH